VLVGFVREDNQEKFLDCSATEYYAGKDYAFSSKIPLNDIHWFAPYISGKGVRDLYRVKMIHTGKKPNTDEDPTSRIVFNIEYVRPLYDEYDNSLYHEIRHGFIYKTLAELKK
jgi:hypothetical protein